MGQDILSKQLIADVRKLIDTAKMRLAVSVNQEMTLLYWQIGKRLKKDILKSK